MLTERPGSHRHTHLYQHIQGLTSLWSAQSEGLGSPCQTVQGSRGLPSEFSKDTSADLLENGRSHRRTRTVHKAPLRPAQPPVSMTGGGRWCRQRPVPKSRQPPGPRCAVGFCGEPVSQPLTPGWGGGGPTSIRPLPAPLLRPGAPRGAPLGVRIPGWTLAAGPAASQARALTASPGRKARTSRFQATCDHLCDRGATRKLVDRRGGGTSGTPPQHPGPTQTTTATARSPRSS